VSLSLLLVLVVIFSYAVSRSLTRWASRFVTLSGVEYVLVGVLIGPHFIWRLMSSQALSAFDPLVSLLLGLAGFMLGLRTKMAIADASSASAGLVATVGVIGVTAASLWPAIEWLAPAGPASFALTHTLVKAGGYAVDLYLSSSVLWTALAIGCAAGAVSTSIVRGVCDAARACGKVTTFVNSAGAVAQNVSVVVFGLMLSSMRATSTADGLSLSVVEWAVTAVAAAVMSGLLFALFIGREDDASRVFLATIGLVTFASGVGSALGISPLFMNLLAGITVAATSTHADRVRCHLDRLQHPLFVLIAIFAGAHWTPTGGPIWLLPAMYVTVRYVARRILTPVAARLFMAEAPRTSRLGHGLLSQGTLAISIGLDYALRRPEHAALVLTTVLVGAFASDLISDRALGTLLADAGETGKLAETPQPPVVAAAEGGNTP
jgi:hypothetical protein